MKPIPLNQTFIIDRTVGVRTKIKEVTTSNAKLETMLKQVLELLREPYNADEEPLIDIPCKINGREDSSYQLGFAIVSDRIVGFYIKRKDGKLSDKNPYMTLEIKEDIFTVGEKNTIKDFIERGIHSLIVEEEGRELVETPNRYKT